jgi:hypothetical protein
VFPEEQTPRGWVDPQAAVGVDASESTRPTTGNVLADFVIHALVGVVIFLVIAAAAAAIAVIVEWLESHKFDPVLIIMLHVAEYGALGMDVVLFLVFMARAASRTWQRS